LATATGATPPAMSRHLRILLSAGRLLEVYRAGPDEDVLVIGKISVWEPRSRFAYSSEVDDTETQVDFEALGDGTKVTVVQTLNPGGEKALYFWPNVIGWFVDRTANQ
jgi:hypothetical protein